MLFRIRCTFALHRYENFTGTREIMNPESLSAVLSRVSFTVRMEICICFTFRHPCTSTASFICIIHFIGLFSSRLSTPRGIEFALNFLRLFRRRWNKFSLTRIAPCLRTFDKKEEKDWANKRKGINIYVFSSPGEKRAP